MGGWGSGDNIMFMIYFFMRYGWGRVCGYSFFLERMCWQCLFFFGQFWVMLEVCFVRLRFVLQDFFMF